MPDHGRGRLAVLLAGLAWVLAAPPMLATSDPIFSSPRGPFGRGAYTAVGDLDEDGHLDLVGWDGSTAAVTILFGAGNGTIRAELRLPVAAGGQHAVAVADFNEDDHLDVAVSSGQVLPGNGDGTFGPPTSEPVVSRGMGVTVADLDLDGHDDLLVASHDAGLSVLLGRGDGTFDAPRHHGPDCYSVSVGDVDGDGVPDVVTGGHSSDTVFRGLGDGTLAPGEERRFGSSEWIAYVASVVDFDADGHVDLVGTGTPNYVYHHVAVVPGNGSGAFEREPVPAFSTLPDGRPAIADFDGDGNLDLAASKQGTLHILLGSGTGEAIPETSYVFVAPYLLEWALTGDFDGDGFPDVALSDWTWDWFAPQGAWIVLNNGPFGGVCDDPDVDGYGSPGSPTCPRGGARDCASGFFFAPSPGFDEDCNNVDDDCDGSVDEEFDVDRDGFPTCGGGDCDDANAAIHPGASEFCDGRDDDCDGAIDEAGPTLCEDGFPCSVEACAVGGTCVRDASGCVAGDGPPYAGRSTYVPEQSPFQLAEPDFMIAVVPEFASMAGGDFDEDGRADVAIAGPDGVLVGLGGADGAILIRQRLDMQRPRSVIAADLDADGHSDLAATSRDGVTVFLGDGRGALLAGGAFGAGMLPTGIAAADLDADGALDLAVTNRNAARVSILLGDGAGGFAAPDSFPVAEHPTAIAVGRLDGDGVLDIVTVHLPTDAVSVLLGDGDGTFGPASTIALQGDGPTAVALADLDDDGDLDLAVANAASDDVSYLEGNGDGTFGAETRIAAGDLPVALLARDVDADADLDLVVAARSSNSLVVLAGDGSGNFASAARIPAGDDPVAVAALDVDGDGRSDLVSCDAGSASLSVALGRNDGFDAPLLLAAGARPTAVAVADLDGDGIQDLTVADEGSVPGSPGSVVVHLGLGGAAFGPAMAYPVGSAPSDVAVGDFDGDGAYDLVVAGTPTMTLAGHGDGTFSAAVPAPGATGGPVGDFDSDGIHDWSDGGMAVGDVTGDGKHDQVRAFCDIEVLAGNGDGTFGPATSVPFADWWQCAYDVAIGDVDRDGNADLVVVTGSGPAVSLGRGDGTFEPPSTFGRWPLAGQWDGLPSVAVADADVDGHLDVATTSPDRGALAVHVGSGDGSFAPPVRSPAGGSSRGLAFGDFDADGRPDLAVPNPDLGAVMLLLNRGPAPPCIDADGDGYGFPPGPACPGGMAADCDDTRAWIHPGALEVENRADEDCDLRIDDHAAPGDVPDLRVSHNLDSQTVVSWGAAAGAIGYELHRGSFSGSQRIGLPYNHGPLMCGWNRLTWRDAETVPPGEGRYYLARARNANGLGHLGLASSGAPIPDVTPCP